MNRKFDIEKFLLKYPHAKSIIDERKHRRKKSYRNLQRLFRV